MTREIYTRHNDYNSSLPANSNMATVAWLATAGPLAIKRCTPLPFLLNAANISTHEATLGRYVRSQSGLNQSRCIALLVLLTTEVSSPLRSHASSLRFLLLGLFASRQ